jgi:hypothetical protein
MRETRTCKSQTTELLRSVDDQKLFIPSEKIMFNPALYIAASIRDKDREMVGKCQVFTQYFFHT